MTAQSRTARSRASASGSAWVIGRVAGIEIGIDRSWILIFVLLTVSLASMLRGESAAGRPVEVWIAAVLASLVFFASIVLHELGHSLVALRAGLSVRSITLFVFGGIASLESEPRRPADEVRIAVAGPLVSVALGLAFRAVAGWLEGAAAPWDLAAASLAWLARINLVLAAFNAVPGFPLDGGRVLRGIVWAVTGSFERATRVAAAAGGVFAWGLIGFGALAALVEGQLLGGLWLAFIGWFLLGSSRATVGQMLYERVLERVRVGEAMEPVGDGLLDGSETVEQIVADALLRRGVRTYYVIGPGGALEGLLSLRELVATPPERRALTRARDVMIPAERLACVGPGETGWDALQRMAGQRVSQLPVVDGARLVGVLTRERLLTLVEAGLALRPKTPS
jgi:Zn-dependent protease/CBS domain-containing protein